MQHSPVDSVGVLGRLLPKPAFAERLEAEIDRARTGGGALSLLAVDIDYFKSINDAFGHARGDEILEEFAGRLLSALRAADIVVRHGGDEFVALLPDAGKREALIVARRLLEMVRHSPFPGTPPLSLSLSIGVAAFPDDAATADELFRRADALLYQAKRRGRDQVAGNLDEIQLRQRLQSPSRILERDTQLNSVYEFLAALPAARRGCFSIVGPRGSGRTRLLAEVATASRLVGYHVLSLHGSPARRGRTFGAFLQAYPELEQATRLGREALAGELAERLRQRNESVLLITVDNLAQIDDVSRQVLKELAADPRLEAVGVVCTSEWPLTELGFALDVPLIGGAAISPLAPTGVQAWLRMVLQWEPPAEFVEWLHRETSGLPDRLQRGLSRLLEISILCRNQSGWEVAPQYSQLSLSAWLDVADRSTASLPPLLSSIVGRDREIEQIKHLLQTERLLTLLGPGGFGKTRLALQVAAEIAEERDQEVCFVPLAPLSSPDFVVPAVAEALRIVLDASQEPKRQLLDKLRSRQLLLVLDNFEHLLATSPLVAEILAAAPTTRVLVTSQETLGIHCEAVYSIGGISLPAVHDLEGVLQSPAAQLFARQAERHSPGFRLAPGNAAQVAQICAALEGSPLAIEIAASLVRLLDCDQILADVRRDLDSLASSSRDTEERHRSLRTVFDHSWKLLSAEERRVWAHLSVFQGGFRRDAAKHVAGATLPMLMVLANKSLLHRAEGGRFEIHETLRHFAGEKLGEAGAERHEIETRYARYYAEFVYARGDRGQAMDVVRMKRETAEEIENIRAGFRWSVEHDHLVEAEHYAKGLFRFYDAYGRFAEGEEAFRRVAARISDARLGALVIARQAYFLAKLGEYDSARRLHVRSLNVLKRLGSMQEGALSLYSLGHIAMQQGQYSRAQHLCRRAARIFRTTGSTYGSAMCLNESGILAARLGSYEVAEERFVRSLEMRREIGDLPGQARCLNNLATVMELRGCSGEARSLFQQSLAVSREAGDQQSVANTLNNLGVLIRHAGLKDGSPELFLESRRCLEEALQVYREIGMDTGLALILHNLGDIAYHLGEDGVAEDHFREALRRTVANDSLPLLCTTLIGTAALMARRGDERGAAYLLLLVCEHSVATLEDRTRAGELLAALSAHLDEEELEAIRESARHGDHKDIATQLINGRGLTGGPPLRPHVPTDRLAFTDDVEATIEEGQLAERNARYADARECYEAALRSLQSTERASEAAPLLRWVGRTYVAEGDFEAAEDCFAASYAAAEAYADGAGMASVMNLRGIAAMQRGELDEAAQSYTQAQVLAQQVDDAVLVSMTDQNLGIIAHIQGDLDTALRHYQASWERVRIVGLEDRVADILNNLGEVYRARNQWREAEDCYQEALRSCIERGMTQHRLTIEANRVELRIDRKNYEEARAICDAAFSLAQEVGDSGALGDLHKHYGVIYRETHQLQLADTHLRLAEQIADERQDLILAAQTARQQAELFWRQQRHQDTLRSLNNAHRWFSQLKARRELADVDRRTAELEELFVDLVRRWSESIEAADPYTQGHCMRVADTACDLARAAGMDEQTLFWFRLGALLHDVGKIVVPLEVLNKPGQLTPEERAIIEQHPDAGVELLSDIEFPWDVRPMVRHHHERWEGRGYPAGLVGDEIPLAARILCIADVYDALTSDRPYRAGFPHEKAIDIMETGMRGHFDPRLFEMFKRITTPGGTAGDDCAGPEGTPRLRVVSAA